MQNDIILKVSDLEKSYNHKKVVNGISFEVKKGEIFGILGPNGAGPCRQIPSGRQIQRRARDSRLPP